MCAAPAERLSIVLPVLDEAEGIVEQLQSLQALRRRGAELIVVDGGSRDGSAERAAAWADQVLIGERGRARQMNRGAAAARAPVLLFLHADTRLPADADQALLDGLAQGRHRWGRFDVRIDGRARVLPLVARMMNLRSRWTGIATGDQALFVQREAFDAVGGFPDQPLMEDVEISRRLGRLSAPLCLRQTVLTSGRRWDQHGPWRTIVLMWRLRLLYWLGVEPERLARLYR